MRYIPLLALSLLCSGCSWFGPNDPVTRTVGTVIDDESIEIGAARAIDRATPTLATANVNVNTFGGVVLLTGQVASEEDKAAAERALADYRKVTRIHNELAIGAPTSLLARQNDTWLTTKVKAQLVADDSVNADRFKVVTENGVVYLLGRVSTAESTRGVEIARNVFGVQRVVTAFDVVDAPATSPP